MRKLLLYIIFFVTYPLFAQQTTLSHYPINPSLFNPAFSGYRGLSEIVMNHRQQWIGIDEAPSVSTFQLTMPLGSRIGLGIRAQRFKRGPISTNILNGIFAYKVPFGRTTGLTFGLAGGISSTGLNHNSSYNPSDPAIAQFSDNQIYPDLKFGINYHIQNFNLGITFTDMIYSDIYKSNPIDDADVKFYENYIVNLDYKFKITASKFSLQPFVLYSTDQYTAPYFEAGNLFHYQELMYVGGSYRQDYGVNILTGLQIKKLSVGYGYELASHMVNTLGQGTHELQISYRFGKPVSEQKKTVKKEKPKIVEEVVLEKDTTDELVKESDLPQKNRAEEFTRLEETPAHTFYYKGDALNELPVGFYVIAGAFKTQENAQKKTSELSRQKLFAAGAYNAESQLYYVYVYRSDSLEKTQIARDSYRKKALLQDAWLLEIKERK